MINVIKALPNVDVYLVGGPSGAGKTVFADAFSRTRKGVIIRLDDYFLDENSVRLSSSSRYGVARQWDHPSSVDLTLAQRNVIELLENHFTRVPTFNFSENKRLGYRPQKIASKSTVVVEGLHALLLSQLLGSYSKFSIFINAEVNVRRQRARIRAENRSRPMEEFDRKFHFRRIAETRWILAQRFLADLVLDTSHGSYTLVKPIKSYPKVKKRQQRN
jgi:uridine kinase